MIISLAKMLCIAVCNNKALMNVKGSGHPYLVPVMPI